MALDFARASSQHVAAGSAIANEPVTFACWFKADDITAQHILISQAGSGVNNLFYVLDAHGGVGGDPIRAVKSTSLGSATASTSTGFGASTWHHAAAVFASDTSRSAYLDGGSKGTDTTSLGDEGGFNTFDIGSLQRSSAIYCDAAIAEAAVWTAALTDAEIACLAAGYSPLCLRPQSLVLYIPLGGRYGRNPNDQMGFRVGSEQGSPTYVDHPPGIIYPETVKVGVTAGAAPAAALPFRQYYMGSGF